MANKILDAFYKKIEADDQLRPLRSHWDIDREILASALENVTKVYAHFSRHNSSHSRQILVNVERILGDTIANLGATDLWLLLEAAYCHDLGMVISDEDLQRTLQQDDFKDYLRRIADNTHHELSGFAQSIAKGKNQIFHDNGNPVDWINKFYQLLADYFRQTHAARSAELVSNPKRLSLPSPRSGLIPERLYGILGLICASHTKNFDDVLLLPFKEVGLGVENCHPRFIACMIRLGDLLDLDNGRFCPVAMRVAGKASASRLAHEEKHASIYHLQIDTTRIEVAALCKTYDGYMETARWIALLKEEMRNQLMGWNDISPGKDVGPLPTLGTLSVSMEDYLELMNDGLVPQITVDQEKILELFQGGGIYSSKWQSIRELLQNAVDSTLLKIWVSKKAELSYDIEETAKFFAKGPTDKKVKNLFKQHKISIAAKKEKQERVEQDEHEQSVWRITIKDKGIGISKKDFEYMLKVGGSTNNEQRQKIIREMPEWMRPSGIFGIGLQSAFQLKIDGLKFTSKSMLSNEYSEIILTDPSGNRGGMSFFKRLPTQPGLSYGTELSFAIENNSSLDLGYNPWNNEYKAPKIAAHIFDPIKKNYADFIAERLYQEINSFGEQSLIGLKILLNSEKITEIYYDRDKMYFDNKSNFFILPQFIYDRDGTGNNDMNIYYRGQYVEFPHDTRPYIPFVSFTCDIMSHSADKILYINRNIIKEEYIVQFEQDLISAFASYLASSEGTLAPDEHIPASCLLKMYGKEQPSYLSDKWENAEIAGTGKTIKELLSLPSFTLEFRNPSVKEVNKTQLDTDNNFQPIVTNLNENIKLLVKVANEFQFSMQFDEQEIILPAEKTTKMFYRFNKDHKLVPYSDNVFRKKLEGVVKWSREIGCRVSVPVWGEFRPLAFARNKALWAMPLDYRHVADRFLLPFSFDQINRRVTHEDLDALCHWLEDNQADKQSPLCFTEIKKLYENCIQWIDNELMKGSDIWKQYRNGFHSSSN